MCLAMITSTIGRMILLPQVVKEKFAIKHVVVIVTSVEWMLYQRWTTAATSHSIKARTITHAKSRRILSVKVLIVSVVFRRRTAVHTGGWVYVTKLIKILSIWRPFGLVIYVFMILFEERSNSSTRGTCSLIIHKLISTEHISIHIRFMLVILARIEEALPSK